jgi:tetratricopeptide (TPR) repeat protein
MPVPPPKIPENLTPSEYLRLGLLYFVMGDDYLGKQSIEFALHLLSTSGEIDSIDQAKWREFQCGLDFSKVREPLDEVPPMIVPDGLTAERYYRLGVIYKMYGWTEQSRDALTRASKMDEGGLCGRLAMDYRRARLPKFPVNQKAMMFNIVAANKTLDQKEEAERHFKDLIAEYPMFEWPYGNLASLYLNRGNLEAATEVLNRVLSFNPDYVNAWHHLARVKILQDDLEGARNCIKNAKHVFTDDEDADRIDSFITELIAFEKNN